MMRIAVLLITALFFPSCLQKQKSSFALPALQKVLAIEQKAHLEKNITLLFPEENSSESVLDISNGMVRKMTAEESRLRFTRYFNTVDIIKWEDVATPIFVFSIDSSLASVTIQKQVVIKEISTQILDTTDFAWNAVYKFTSGKWKMISITSTKKQD